MEVIDRLNTKKAELEERLSNLYQGGSNRRETLEYKLKKIAELIAAYQSAPSPVYLSEAEKIFEQQVGFEEQKEKILNSLKIKGFCQQHNIQQHPRVLCLIGSPGVGKTTFAQILAQALKKEFFLVALGGMSDSSLLVGANESSGGTEIGQLTKALAETKTHDLLILLDEIDKVNSYRGNSAAHNCLNAILDPTQNKEILDCYLDVKLDLSRVTFVVTVNDPKKIPDFLLSRVPMIVELPGYNLEQKKAIANQFIEKWFSQNSTLNQNNLEITTEALETLINKTKEKGVRQLKSALDSIFDYCLLQWSEAANQGRTEKQVKINSELVHKIIPNDFFNVDIEDNQKEGKDDKKYQAELASLRQELEEVRRGKNQSNKQIKLKGTKLNSLFILRQNKKNLTAKEYYNYELKINAASTWEEIELIEKEILTKIQQKLKSKRASGEKENKPSKVDDLEQKLKAAESEIDKLKKEIQAWKKLNKSSWNIENNYWFIISLVIFIGFGIFWLKSVVPDSAKKKKKTRKLFLRE